MVSFRFSGPYRTQYPEVQQKWVQTLLRAKGWIVPNYELAPDLQNIEILRVVIRENVSAVLVDRLVADIVRALLVLWSHVWIANGCIPYIDRDYPGFGKGRLACSRTQHVAGP